MTDLPQNWVVCTVSDVTAPVHTIDASRVEDRDIRYVDISSIDNVANKIGEPKKLRLSSAPSRARQIVQTGDVLFSTVRPYLRNIAQVPEALNREIASTGFAVLRPVDGVVPGYLFYKTISRDFVSALTGEQYGVSYPAVKDEQVRAQPFELPPTEEQRRIVAKIEELFSELDEGVESLTTSREKLKLYRQAVLKHAFEGKLTTSWRDRAGKHARTAHQLVCDIRNERERRYEHLLEAWSKIVSVWNSSSKKGKKPSKPERPKAIPPLGTEQVLGLTQLPATWSWTRFGELFAVSPQNGIYKPAQDYGSGTYIVRIDDFYDGKLIRTSGFKRLSLNSEELQQYQVMNGDLLINRVNSIEYLGKCALVDGLEEATVFESNIMKCRIVEGINKGFLTAYLASHGGRKRICGNAKHAVNQASVNQTDVSLTPIPIAPLDEQTEIIRLLDEKLSLVNRALDDIDKQLQKADALRHSILKKAFSGQLVAQNPRDEPASELLERIHAEKAEQANGKKNNKRKEAA